MSGVLRRIPEVGFKTAIQSGLSGLGDREVLEIAAGESRILVSNDWRTMPYHFGTFVATRFSPGVLIAPRQLGVGKTIEELLAIWSDSEAEEYCNSIRRLPV